MFLPAFARVDIGTISEVSVWGFHFVFLILEGMNWGYFNSTSKLRVSNEGIGSLKVMLIVYLPF